MSDRGWCPFARQHRGQGEGPFGYPAGERGQNKPVMFVDHIMAGWKSTLDNDTWRHQNWVGVTFGLGRDGSADQYTNIFDAHWGNGIAGRLSLYRRDNPRLGALEKEPGARWNPRPKYSAEAHSLDKGQYNLLNARSISTEHEGFPNMFWTPEMYASSLRTKIWCLEELEREGMPMEIDISMLVGHFMIDGVNRASCPGPNWPRTQLYAELEAKMAEVTKGEFAALFRFCLETRDVVTALGGGLYAVAKTVGVQGEELDKLEAAVEQNKKRVAEVEKFLLAHS